MNGKSKIRGKLCPDCRKLVHFHVESKNVKCTGCKTTFDIVEYEGDFRLIHRPWSKPRPVDEATLDNFLVRPLR